MKWLLSVLRCKDYLFLFKQNLQLECYYYNKNSNGYFLIYLFLDYKADSYHWREQGGAKTVKYKGISCKKQKFFSVIGHSQDEQKKPQLSAEFLRIVYSHPDYPLRRLVIYDGKEDVQVIIDYHDPVFSYPAIRVDRFFSFFSFLYFICIFSILFHRHCR